MSAVIGGVLVGAGATLIGLIAKFGVDLITERRTRAREDLIWRRERYVEAAANLLQTGWDLAGANARVSRALFALMNAEATGIRENIEHQRKIQQEALDEHWPLPAKAHLELQQIRLYGPPEVHAAAEALVEDTRGGGSFPDVQQLGPAWTASEKCREALADAVTESLNAPKRRRWWRRDR